MRNGTGSTYYAEVARGYRADLAARAAEGEDAVTWRHRVMAQFFDVIAVPGDNVDALDRQILKLRQLLEDWHEDVLVNQHESSPPRPQS